MLIIVPGSARVQYLTYQPPMVCVIALFLLFIIVEFDMQFVRRGKVDIGIHLGLGFIHL